jgi:hypothetical protein
MVLGVIGVAVLLGIGEGVTAIAVGVTLGHWIRRAHHKSVVGVLGAVEVLGPDDGGGIQVNFKAFHPSFTK